VEYAIDFGGAPQDVTIRTSGLATADGLIGFVSDLVGDAQFRPGMSILVDHTQLDARPLTGADIRAMAEAVIRLDERIGTSRVAILVPNPLTFGYARMYELHAAETQLHSRVFYSRDEALNWLAKPPAVVAEA
jgi:hypothetical protein